MADIINFPEQSPQPPMPQAIPLRPDINPEINNFHRPAPDGRMNSQQLSELSYGAKADNVFILPVGSIRSQLSAWESYTDRRQQQHEPVPSVEQLEFKSVQLGVVAIRASRKLFGRFFSKNN